MIVNCKWGLFVGVDSYGHLAHPDTLNWASRDAIRMGDFFQTASQPADAWEVLTEGPNRIPDRCEILEAIHRLGNRVGNNEAGMIYFAGHARLLDSGLVLVPADFRPSIPSDSGILLSRLLQILECFGESRFMVFLDTCRIGLNADATDSLPDNVLVMYTCDSGGQSFEEENGGVGTSAFLLAMSHVANSQQGGVLTCSLDIIANETQRRCPSKIELTGANVSDFYLPLVTSPSPSTGSRSAGPRFTLLTRALTGTEHSKLCQWIANDWRTFFPRIGTVNCKLDESIPGRRSLRISVPMAATYSDQRAFIIHLLNRFTIWFSHVEVVWNCKLPILRFYHIRNLCTGTEISRVAERDAYEIKLPTDRSPTAAFKINVTWPRRGSTTAVITSHAVDGDSLPLYCSVSGVIDVINIMQMISG